jgi:hypothetical protein
MYPFLVTRTPDNHSGRTVPEHEGQACLIEVQRKYKRLAGGKSSRCDGHDGMRIAIRRLAAREHCAWILNDRADKSRTRRTYAVEDDIDRTGDAWPVIDQLDLLSADRVSEGPQHRTFANRHLIAHVCRSTRRSALAHGKTLRHSSSH